MLVASARSLARLSPVLQATASRPSTYWLPRLEIDPTSTALLPVRRHSSRATSAVTRSVGVTTHQAQSLAHLAVGQNIEEWRLLQIHSQSLFEGAIEHRVASCVFEVGQDHRNLFPSEVLRGESEIESATDQNSNRDQARREPESSGFFAPAEGASAAITALEDGARATCWLDPEVEACVV